MAPPLKEKGELVPPVVPVPEPLPVPEKGME